MKGVKQEVHKLNHYTKMKINDIIECFNKNLDRLRKDNKPDFCGYFTVHSYWEKVMGTLKTAHTIIEYVKSSKDKEIIIHTCYSSTIIAGHENALIEESERRALTFFIEEWTNNVEQFVNNTFTHGS